MTIEQAIANIEKELKCRKEEIDCIDYWYSNSVNYEDLCCNCPNFVSYENLTDTLQTLYNWLSAEKGCKGCKFLRSDNICKNDRCARMYKDRYSRGE
jgi:hypothetical protein